MSADVERGEELAWDAVRSFATSAAVSSTSTGTGSTFLTHGSILTADRRTER